MYFYSGKKSCLIDGQVRPVTKQWVIWTRKVDNEECTNTLYVSKYDKLEFGIIYFLNFEN